jgi:hypothetical protein
MSNKSNKPSADEMTAQEKIQEMAQRYAPDALRVSVDVMHDRRAPPGVRLAAANTLLERAYGTPSRAFVVRETSLSPEERAKQGEWITEVLADYAAMTQNARVLAQRLSQELGFPFNPEESYNNIIRQLQELGILSDAEDTTINFEAG